ncbi:MAG: hypothetical protein WCI17_06240 [bacterium]
MAETAQKPGEMASVSWLQQRLRQAAERRRTIEFLTLLCVSLALVVLGMAAYGLADWLVRFPRAVRLVLTLGFIAAGTLALRRHAPRWIPRLASDDLMARLAEQVQERDGRPAHSRLVAAIEFGERPGIPGDLQLKNRVIREARSECADPCDLRLHNPLHVRLARRLGGAAAAAAVACLAFFPGTSRVFLQRMLGSQVYYPTATTLGSVDWRPVAPARQNYPVRVTVNGRVPSSGMLRVRMPGRRSFDLPLLATEGTNTFGTVIPAPEKPFTFTFRMGDFESNGYAVRVAEPLYVKSGSVQVEPPGYVRQRKVTETLGSLTVPEGSRLKFVIVPDREAREVNLLADGRAVPMKRQDDDAWALALEVTNSFAYEIAMKDGYGMENADRLKRNLTMAPDAPPVVEVRQPKSDGFISVASLVPFEVQARDEYGLVRLNLSYDVQQRVNDKDVSVRKGTIPLEHAAVTGKVAVIEQMLRATDLNLTPGQRIVFRVSATDNRPGRPNVGQSAEIGLQVVEPDELKRVLSAEMTQMASLMRKLRDSEKKQELAISQRLSAEGGNP